MDDDDEDIDDQDEMMADEPLETLEEEDEEDYESEEDTPVIDQDFMNDGADGRLLRNQLPQPNRICSFYRCRNINLCTVDKQLNGFSGRFSEFNANTRKTFGNSDFAAERFATRHVDSNARPVLYPLRPENGTSKL
jgi:hypothetical protein